MDYPRNPGHPDAESALREGTADAQDEVGGVERLAQLARIAAPPEPGESGCVSSQAPLPSRLVEAGAASSSANSLSSA